MSALGLSLPPITRAKGVRKPYEARDGQRVKARLKSCLIYSYNMTKYLGPKR